MALKGKPAWRRWAWVGSGSAQVGAHWDAGPAMHLQDCSGLTRMTLCCNLLQKFRPGPTELAL